MRVGVFQFQGSGSINENGRIVSEAPKNQEYLLIYDYSVPAIGYGAKGRIQYSNELLDIGTNM